MDDLIYKLSKEEQYEIDTIQDKYGMNCSPAVVSVICEHLIGAYVTEAFIDILKDKKKLTVKVKVESLTIQYKLTYTDTYKTVFSVEFI